VFLIYVWISTFKTARFWWFRGTTAERGTAELRNAEPRRNRKTLGGLAVGMFMWHMCCHSW